MKFSHCEVGTTDEIVTTYYKFVHKTNLIAAPKLMIWLLYRLGPIRNAGSTVSTSSTNSSSSSASEKRLHLMKKKANTSSSKKSKWNVVIDLSCSIDSLLIYKSLHINLKCMKHLIDLIKYYVVWEFFGLELLEDMI